LSLPMGNLPCGDGMGVHFNAGMPLFFLSTISVFFWGTFKYPQNMGQP
jgi:hypothetical protein